MTTTIAQRMSVSRVLGVQIHLCPVAPTFARVLIAMTAMPVPMMPALAVSVPIHLFPAMTIMPAPWMAAILLQAVNTQL